MSSRRRSDPGQGAAPSPYPGTFLLAFREAASQINWRVRRWQNQIAECVNEVGEERTVYVENLFRRARRTARAEWPELILDFLRTVASADDIENLPTDLATVADRLLVRLGQPLPTLDEEIAVWSQPLPDTDLCLNLVVDYDNRMCYVTDQLVEGSGQPGDFWLKRALANLKARTPAECFQLMDEESGILLSVAADAYDSSRALLLSELLPATRAEGYFVALPGRDELLVLPITVQGLTHVHLLKVLAEKNFRSTPYPISDEVYWIKENVWHVFPVVINGDKVSIEPPEAFIPVLKSLLPEDRNGTDESEAETT